jgi:hypothetical protein
LKGDNENSKGGEEYPFILEHLLLGWVIELSARRRLSSMLAQHSNIL